MEPPREATEGEATTAVRSPWQYLGFMSASPEVRSLRAAVFAVLCVLLAAGGHGLASGRHRRCGRTVSDSSPSSRPAAC